MQFVARRFMDSIKVLSKQALQRVIDMAANKTKTVKWRSGEVVIKQLLPLSDFIKVVRTIITDCRTSDGSLAIELLDFATRINVISAYAFIDLPTNIDEAYCIAYASELYETICNTANRYQIDAIISTVKMIVSSGVDYEYNRSN